jgi:hypothetical protein
MFAAIAVEQSVGNPRVEVVDVLDDVVLDVVVVLSVATNSEAEDVSLAEDEGTLTEDDT